MEDEFDDSRSTTDNADLLDKPPTRCARARPARLVQDGHSHTEQAVYNALWARGVNHDSDADGNRIVTIGLGELANRSTHG